VIGTPTLTPFGATAAPMPSPTPSASATLTPCYETEGQVIERSFSSRMAAHEVRYRVYLPPCYALTDRRYPYVIMLHGLGYGMDDGQWVRLGLTEAADLGYTRGSLPPMIIVMPNGNDAFYADDAGPFPEMIVEELIPLVEASFCSWNDPSKRAIGGLSRGGFWAYWIAFRYPELFSRVGGHSGYFYDAYTPTDKNPNNLVDTAQGIEHLAMYLDHGAQDHDVDERVQDFAERLRRRGIEPDYVVNPVGQHVEDYWAAHTADYLAFYAADWPRDIATYPSCHDPSL